jgi:hypothetical protein
VVDIIDFRIIGCGDGFCLVVDQKKIASRVKAGGYG